MTAELLIGLCYMTIFDLSRARRSQCATTDECAVSLIRPLQWLHKKYEVEVISRPTFCIDRCDCFRLLTSHGAKTTRPNTIGRLRIKSSCTHDNPDYAGKTLSTGHWPWVDNLRFRCPGIALLIGATLYT